MARRWDWEPAKADRQASHPNRRPHGHRLAAHMSVHRNILRCIIIRQTTTPAIHRNWERLCRAVPPPPNPVASESFFTRDAKNRIWDLLHASTPQINYPLTNYLVLTQCYRRAVYW